MDLKIADSRVLLPMLGNCKTLIIDEAQRIENIGLKLKILQDNYGDKVQFIVTGSSSFDLANKINESVTGRKWTFWLSSPSINELVQKFGYETERANLGNCLIYGTYPAVISNLSNARITTTELASDSLCRGVLTLGGIIKTDKLRNILKALALQIGRNTDQQEVDFVLEHDGELTVIEIKYSKKNVKLPKTFVNAYYPAHTAVITKDDYLEYFADMQE